MTGVHWVLSLSHVPYHSSDENLSLGTPVRRRDMGTHGRADCRIAKTNSRSFDCGRSATFAQDDIGQYGFVHPHPFPKRRGKDGAPIVVRIDAWRKSTASPLRLRSGQVFD